MLRLIANRNFTRDKSLMRIDMLRFTEKNELAVRLD